MVIAATLKSIIRRDARCCSSYKIVSANPLYVPKDKEKRQHLRRKEWNIWLSSTSDDIDLVSDWWFFWMTYNDRSGFDDQLVLLLFIFCCLGSLTWLLQLIQISCLRGDGSWAWLQILILVVEDIPQLVLTLLINGWSSNLTNLGLFNIMTSFYSLLIRIAGELFMDCCYCCERVDDGVSKQQLFYSDA